jgi:pyruvate dehydrogenase E2 component (dihydrolipoamide acetyltransferase)
MAEVSMPQLGETVTEGTITRWFKQVGDTVSEDEVLFEVSTDKVDSEVPSPVSGVIAEIRVPEGETVEVGTVLAIVDGSAAPPGPPPAAEVEPPPPSPPPPPPPPSPPAPPPPPPSAPGPAPAPVTTPVAGHRVLSPIVRRLLEEHALDAADIGGTGVGGRITRSDVERAIQAQGAAPAVAAVERAAPRAAGDRETVVPLSHIRRRTAEHMVRSKATSPHAMTAVEVDFEAVDRVRRAHGERWRAEEGFGLTYLPFIARAVIDAIEEFPHLNATVSENDLIVHNYVNLSIAVDLDFEGLLAPVVSGADQKRLRAIARDVHDLAHRARTKQLSADEVVDGTFTITNAGSYGTFMVIPVINQPQVAILSTDGVRRKPVVVTAVDGSEGVAIHPIGILAMSWDHRAFDGAYSAAFMARVRDILESRDWEAEL